MANNVITFPKSKIVQKGATPPSTPEEIKMNLDCVKYNHVQETISLIAPMIFQQLSLAGFELMEDEDIDSIKDTAFLIEAIKAMLYKYYELEHPFQKIAQNVFTENNGLLSITDTLELVLRLDEERV